MVSTFKKRYLVEPVGHTGSHQSPFGLKRAGPDFFKADVLTSLKWRPFEKREPWKIPEEQNANMMENRANKAMTEAEESANTSETMSTC